MAKKPVILYGASGYTGRLIAEYLREFDTPFIAAGRDAARIQQTMDHVPGLQPSLYEVVQVPHSIAALSELFRGSKVVCSTVGPFATFGAEVVEACLHAGCHYLDTTGEQNWIRRVDEEYGPRFAAKSLLAAPAVAQMYTSGEIAAELCLETPGLDTLDTLVLWKGFPTYASTQSIFTILMADHFYLEQKQYMKWPPATAYEVVVPGQHQTALALAWGGTSHPVTFRRDPRVANVRSLGGVFDRSLMQGVVEIAKMVEEKIKPLPPAEQKQALSAAAAQVQAGMPPRENQRINTSLDSVYASGPLGKVHCVIHGACNYKQTGVLQAHAIYHLLHGTPRRVGFASACQAFGHRQLLGALQSFGLVGQPIVTGAVSPERRIGHGF
jgi:short subunit dehydrogenase-like uncharacterized protein